MMEIVNKFLELRGHRTYSATNGVEALQRAIALQPDLILLDTRLPDISGYDLCYTLKAIQDTRHIPVVFMTDYYHDFDRRQARQVGGAGYLIKPFHGDDLYRCLEAHLPQLNNGNRPITNQQHADSQYFQSDLRFLQQC
jgi:CheY-like chemotaxis protein